MFQQITTRVALVLAGVVSVAIAFRLIVTALTPILGPALMNYILAGAQMLWNYVTPGLAALGALGMLVGLWWLFLGRRRR